MASSPKVENEQMIKARSPIRSLNGVQILSTGSHVPEFKVTNKDLSELGFDEDWIIQRTGIQSRRKLAPELATSDMAFEAAQSCLENVDFDRDEIDLVIVATMTPDSPIPSVACQIQDRLELNAGAMDLNAACAGFMYALITGMQYIKSGSSNAVLVIGADTNTRIVNPADKKTFPLFGDGAGAVLLAPGTTNQGLRSYTLGAQGDGFELLGIKAGGSRYPLTAESMKNGDQFIHMDGRSVFKWAVRLLSDTVRDVLNHVQLQVKDLDLVILHQANARIIDAAAEAIGFDRNKIVVNLNQYGNTSAGSIPIGLDEAHRNGRIAPGDHILLCGFGAGLAWGTSVVRW